MTFEDYPDAELMMFDLADLLASELSMALRQNDAVSFCVPGGTTPGPIFDVLSGVKLDWDRVTVLPSDERWVPESHERSNARLIRQRLLTGRAANARFLPLYADAPEPEAVLDRLAAEIEPLLPLNVLLLGMGADMHTASLFPGADGLAEALDDDAPLLVPIRAPGAGETRVTLSARVLADAMSCHVVITGAEKRKALERAQDLSADEAPILSVLANATVHWAP
ncbi:6-phosphogluconolactonase [Defluviimonas sp. WL0024]|uniref:6-phosphogluconolactonase n=2 Tax=Albidovulum TaxID=205889 RepID=A0ABT3IXL5_9RHOB|nr:MULTISPECIES: 6-phosphogluconolactonase [Defluviimonas]MCU9846532.1 6-phosphogluconolactonase [Defluviimonas sp. WL0024]MCW3780111.1 6-phosphogluconolactonase [Defluviimonas salinarum]